MKQIVKIILTMICILGLIPTAFAVDRDAVDMAARGIIRGDSTGDLHLEKAVSRQEAIVFIVRWLGKENEIGKDLELLRKIEQAADGVAGWATGYMEAGIKADIMTARELLGLNWNLNATRQEISYWVSRAAGLDHVTSITTPEGTMSRSEMMSLLAQQENNSPYFQRSGYGQIEKNTGGSLSIRKETGELVTVYLGSQSIVYRFGTRISPYLLQVGDWINYALDSSGRLIEGTVGFQGHSTGNSNLGSYDTDTVEGKISSIDTWNGILSLKTNNNKRYTYYMNGSVAIWDRGQAITMNELEEGDEVVAYVNGSNIEYIDVVDNRSSEYGSDYELYRAKIDAIDKEDDFTIEKVYFWDDDEWDYESGKMQIDLTDDTEIRSRYGREIDLDDFKESIYENDYAYVVVDDDEAVYIRVWSTQPSEDIYKGEIDDIDDEEMDLDKDEVWDDDDDEWDNSSGSLNNIDVEDALILDGDDLLDWDELDEGEDIILIRKHNSDALIIIKQ